MKYACNSLLHGTLTCMFPFTQSSSRFMLSPSTRICELRKKTVFKMMKQRSFILWKASCTQFFQSHVQPSLRKEFFWWNISSLANCLKTFHWNGWICMQSLLQYLHQLTQDNLSLEANEIERTVNFDIFPNMFIQNMHLNGVFPWEFSDEYFMMWKSSFHIWCT